MIVNSWIDLPHEYGSLDLHFVELCTSAPSLYNTDPLYREHRPYASWLIDLNRSGCQEYSALTDKLKFISAYSFSGDGSFVALKTVMGEKKYLELWSVKEHGLTDKKARHSKNKGDLLDGGNNDSSEKISATPHHATPVAWIQLFGSSLDIALSWDGSLVALTSDIRPDTNADENGNPSSAIQSQFGVFQCIWNDTKASKKSSSKMSFVRHDVQRTCPRLRDYIGEFKFHMVDSSNPDPKDELFITCNGVTIDVYSTFEVWTPLRSIVMDSTVTSLSQAPDMYNVLLERTRGRYLIISNRSTALTFDIVQGTLVSFSSALLQEDLGRMTYYSSVSEDGSLTAITGFRHVSVYRTRTWTLHGSYEFHEITSDESLSKNTFLCNGSLLLVAVEPIDYKCRKVRPGYVLDVATMSVVGRMAPDWRDYFGLASLDGSEQSLAYVGHSQFWDMRLEDRVYQSSQKRPDRCMNLCKNPECHDSGVQEGTSSSGLYFKTQRIDASTSSILKHDKHDKRSSIAVTMTDVASSRVKMIMIPFAKSDVVYSATFFANYRYLMIETGSVKMTWAVPTTFDGEFRLHMVLCVYFLKSWSICDHGFMRYNVIHDDNEVRSLVSHITHPIPELMTSAPLFSGVPNMVRIYGRADPGLRQEILRFYGKNLNRSFDGDQRNLFTFLTYLWSPKTHDVYCDFLKHLLALPGTRWVPPQDMSVSVNPLAILLDKSRTEPLVIGLAQIIVDYCFRRAKDGHDQHFLLPIHQCLHLLADLKQQYPELALKINRELAYFPSQSREFIIGHHALANPLELRWAFWRPYPWGLHQYKDQVMQLETVKIPSPPKGNFTREVFQASFDMLWRKPEVAEGSQDDSDKSKMSDHVRKLFSWPQAISTMVLRKCRLKYSKTIECYPFELEALDNPALMALVEYKWNTIGFQYWFIRFLAQLCYYILVLTAVFLQIYGDNRVTEDGVLISDPGPEGLYIAIIVIACTFQWLELVQVMKEKREYFKSVYNVVDFLVFSLPLAGAINQILIIHGVISVGVNPEILSFSVLLVFLHILFELRVFQTVCHFVSIIIRAIYSIRVFIFVFSGGLLAFAIAILHLLHTCVAAKQCSYYTEGFSPNLLRALSVTYFMMGGNYDPVDGGFSSDSVAFHAMMMIFFFFTVIVMLNVLIALINNAIDDGDQTWQLDWLEYRMRYVESAENMTYDIPGFREKHNYFPDTIYYTGTVQQVREYEHKTRQLTEGESATEFTGPAVTYTTVPVAIVTSETAGATTRTTTAAPSENEISTPRRMVGANTMARLMDTAALQTPVESEHTVTTNAEKKIEELQQQLNEQQKMLKEQQRVMGEQQQILLQILGKLDRTLIDNLPHHQHLRLDLDMADCIVNIPGDAQVNTLASLESSSEGMLAPSTAGSMSPSTTAHNEPITSSSKTTTVHRWYPREDEEVEGQEPTEELYLSLEEEHQPPIKIDATRTTVIWEIPLPSGHEGGIFYDIVLGVSVKDLDIDSIDSILLKFRQLSAYDDRYESEIINIHELKRLALNSALSKEETQEQKPTDDAQVLRWKLFNQYYCNEDKVLVSMDISTWSDLPYEYGSLSLHFIELCADSTTLYSADPLYREHCPYASWLIDVNRGGCPEYDSITDKLKIVTGASFSGDGRSAAIMTMMEDGAYLEVWDLEDHNAELKVAMVSKAKDEPIDVGDSEGPEKTTMKPHRAAPLAWMRLSESDIYIAISWDGSLVSMTDRTLTGTNTEENEGPSTTPHKSEFSVFQCSRHDTMALEKSTSRMSLVRHDVQRTCPELRDFIGDGVFHMVDKSNPDPQDELFITCDGITINVYSTVEAWAPLRSILMNSAVTSTNPTPQLGDTILRQIRGRYLITGDEETAYTFDITKGIQVAYTSALTFNEMSIFNLYSSVSDDGSLIAIPEFRQVKIYRTDTWTLQGSYVFHDLELNERVTTVSFLCNSSLLMVRTGHNESLAQQLQPGYILDVVTMSVVDRAAPDGGETFELAPLDGSDQGLAYIGYSRLRHMRLEDRILSSHPKCPTRCTDDCNDSGYRDVGEQEGFSLTGLHFKIKSTNASTGSHHKRDRKASLTVTMADSDGSRAKKMVVPMPTNVSTYFSAFFANCQYLLIVTTEAYMAWTLPATFDGDFRLRMVLLAEFIEDMTICPHGFIRCRFKDEEEVVVCNHITHPVSQDASEAFIIGVTAMARIYDLADAGLRQDILRCYGRYLNYYGLKDNLLTNVLAVMADSWSSRAHVLFCDFFKNLLASPHSRWVPHQDMTIDVNPLKLLLDFASNEPLASEAAEILIDYCLQMAKDEQDPHFLLPIRQCLPILVDSKQQYSELAFKVYREMAYFPAQGRDFIVKHHTLAKPVTPRWTFWKAYQWGLHQHKDQVMQLDLVNLPEPVKGNFTRDMFHASFDMLWRKPEVEESQDASGKKSEEVLAQTLFSWPQAILTMVLRKCRLSCNSTVECYPFELETLDNPALVALVEYKWNTIGFNYWFIRFLGQLCFYIMVLTAVFLQIYGENRVEKEEKITLISEPGPEVLFIAIIPVAFLFLWLELVQLMKDKRGYINSIYNWVDFFVFLIPLVGAVNQLLIIHGVVTSNLNPGLLSYSVLLIFLHFLFELRVFQIVCHFVSIIIRAIYSIRVFIFVFSGGILGFAIAILHLLHTCVNAEQCSYYTEGYSTNLLRAISMTYFMMGGNYDPVKGGFSSYSAAFHIMMIVFFFFTVILMLNVLIALINNAISDGDQTWQLDWLEYRMRYVESAENMTYDIPGFRENHNYFPDTIFYTATAQKVRDYAKESQRRADEAGLTTPATVMTVSTAVATIVESGATSSSSPPPVASEKQQDQPATLTTSTTVTATITSPDTTSTLLATAPTSALTRKPSKAAGGGRGEDALMVMLQRQQEEQSRRDEAQLRRYEEQMRRSDEQMKLLAEQSSRLEEQRLAMVDLQDELRSLKESGAGREQQ
ncbi:hypothetical protein BGZ95_011621 [Linnemannia exigua]|uniref:Ion transport domain-containing protein n=1 Tax=Linnemannia exigua TaxID=604196 RepID=A0AAD4H524_9FUNG|nr:hypothetical protein BGZ95_011621 [Linnemannia exigua]